MLTKEECRESLSDLYNVLCNRLNEEMQDYRQDFERLGKLIEEHFSNPPLYMDEIPKGIWIWDNADKEYIRSLGCVELDGIIYVKLEHSENSFISSYLEYEPNRFYRKEVKDVN